MVTIGPYTLAGTLGVGTFGKVKLATHYLTNEKVAIKIINKLKMETLSMSEKIRREITILSLLKHPHVIRLYELIDTPSDIFMITEYVSGGELFDYIVHKLRLRESEARRFFQQIISGVEYCHQNMVVHRDLKPENLLLDSNLHVKIADFGLSNTMRNGEFLKTSCGSPNYASPEVVSGKSYGGPEVDVWSCGVVLYALLCGSLPFDDENVPSLFRKIKHGNFTLPGHLSNEAKDLIVQMLVVDPAKRINFSQIRSHKWFRLNLPDYLQVGPCLTMGRSNMQDLDEGIIREMSDLGMKNLDGKRMDELSTDERVSYQLLYNRRSRRSSFTDLLPIHVKHSSCPAILLDSSEEFSEELKKRFLYNKTPPIIPAASESSSSSVRFRGADGRPTSTAPHTINIPQNAVSQTWGPSRWRLGLEFTMESLSLIREIFTVLAQNEYEWFCLTPWRFRCRKRADALSSSSGNNNNNNNATIFDQSNNLNNLNQNQNQNQSTYMGGPAHNLISAAQAAAIVTNQVSAQDVHSDYPPDRGKTSENLANESTREATSEYLFSSDENPALQVQVYKINSGRYLVDMMLAGPSGQILPGTVALLGLAAAFTKNSILSRHLISAEQLESSSSSSKRNRHKEQQR